MVEDAGSREAHNADDRVSRLRWLVEVVAAISMAAGAVFAGLQVEHLAQGLEAEAWALMAKDVHLPGGERLSLGELRRDINQQRGIWALPAQTRGVPPGLPVGRFPLCQGGLEVNCKPCPGAVEEIAKRASILKGENKGRLIPVAEEYLRNVGICGGKNAENTHGIAKAIRFTDILYGNVDDDQSQDQSQSRGQAREVFRLMLRAEVAAAASQDGHSSDYRGENYDGGIAHIYKTLCRELVWYRADGGERQQFADLISVFEERYGPQRPATRSRPRRSVPDVEEAGDECKPEETLPPRPNGQPVS